MLSPILSLATRFGEAGAEVPCFLLLAYQPSRRADPFGGEVGDVPSVMRYLQTLTGFLRQTPARVLPGRSIMCLKWPAAAYNKSVHSQTDLALSFHRLVKPKCKTKGNFECKADGNISNWLRSLLMTSNDNCLGTAMVLFGYIQSRLFLPAFCPAMPRARPNRI